MEVIWRSRCVKLIKTFGYRRWRYIYSIYMLMQRKNDERYSWIRFLVVFRFAFRHFQFERREFRYPSSTAGGKHPTVFPYFENRVWNKCALCAESIFIIHFLFTILSLALKSVYTIRALHCLFETTWTGKLENTVQSPECVSFHFAKNTI